MSSPTGEFVGNTPYAPQPYLAYVWIRLLDADGHVDLTFETPTGGNTLTGVLQSPGSSGNSEPVNLTGFSFVRTTRSGETNLATVTLFDPNWVKIEPLIRSVMMYEGNIEFEYGYSGGLLSPIYRGTIMSCRTSYTIDGINLEITIRGRGATTPSAMAEKSRVFTGPIHEIVEQICVENGWDYDEESIARAARVLRREGALSSEETDAVIMQTRMNDYKFIGQVLASLAQTEADGIGGWRMWWDDSSNSRAANVGTPHAPKFYFRPPPWSQGEIVRIYEYMRSKDSAVISFEPDIPDYARIVGGGGVTGVPYIDQITKERGMISISKYTEAATTAATALNLFGLNFAGTGIINLLRSTGLYDDETKAVTNTYLSPVASKAIAEAFGKSFSQPKYDQEFTANLQVIGDPHLNIDQLVTVRVIQPDMTLHPASGNYLIQEITDEISPGSFTTTMALHAFGLPDPTGTGEGDSVNEGAE